jgi:preprotein translocase subunit SecY
MIQALRNAVTLPDLRRKLLYTLLILIIYRLATIMLPVPGVDQEALSAFLAQTTGAGQFFNVLNMLSGGAIERLSVMANGVQSYITAQLIVQLLTPIIPALERLQEEGETGQQKLNRIVYYVTIPLSLLQSYGSIQLINSSYTVKVLPNFGFTAVENILPTVTVLVSMVAGTMFAMWLGELISEQGIGSGISLIIFSGIVAGMPQNVVSLWTQGKERDVSGGLSVLLLVIVLALMAVTMFVIVVVQEGERRIQVRYGKQMRGMKIYGGGSSHIPLRLNTVGMIPLIFAQAFLTFPAIIAQFFVNNESVGKFANGVISFFTPGQSSWYIPLYFLAVVGFTYFYTDVMVQQQDLPGMLKKHGGHIPGYTPGKKTADHINSIYRRITLVGAVFLGAVAILPLVTDLILYSTLEVRASALLITASGLLIVVGTVIDTMRQLEAQLVMRHYEGFF